MVIKINIIYVKQGKHNHLEITTIERGEGGGDGDLYTCIRCFDPFSMLWLSDTNCLECTSISYFAMVIKDSRDQIYSLVFCGFILFINLFNYLFDNHLHL